MEGRSWEWSPGGDRHCSENMMRLGILHCIVWHFGAFRSSYHSLGISGGISVVIRDLPELFLH
jgi:hypothetical protein